MLRQTATGTGVQGTMKCACYQGRKSDESLALVEHVYQQRILRWSAGNNSSINDKQVMGVAMLYHMPMDVRTFHKPYMIHF